MTKGENSVEERNTQWDAIRFQMMHRGGEFLQVARNISAIIPKQMVLKEFRSLLRKSVSAAERGITYPIAESNWTPRLLWHASVRNLAIL